MQLLIFLWCCSAFFLFLCATDIFWQFRISFSHKIEHQREKTQKTERKRERREERRDKNITVMLFFSAKKKKIPTVSIKMLT